MTCKDHGHSCRDSPSRKTTEWSALDDEELGCIDQAKLTRSYEPGEVVFHQGDVCRGVYCIQSGLVGLRRVDEDGNSALLRLCKARKRMVRDITFNKHEHRNTAEVLVPTVTCLIRRSLVARLLNRNPKLGERFLGHCLADMTRTEADYARSLTLKMKARFLHVPMIFHEQTGYRDQYQNFVLELPIQRRQLADLVGATPESVSRIIRSLETDGLLRFEDRRVSFSDIDRIFQEIGPVQ